MLLPILALPAHVSHGHFLSFLSHLLFILCLSIACGLVSAMRYDGMRCELKMLTIVVRVVVVVMRRTLLDDCKWKCPHAMTAESEAARD